MLVLAAALAILLFAIGSRYRRVTFGFQAGPCRPGAMWAAAQREREREGQGRTQEREGPPKKIDGPPVHLLNPRPTYLPANFSFLNVLARF
jgi:hypothetical protein